MPKSAVLLALFIFSGLSHAQIFKCTDPKTQKINFTDKPCNNQELSSQITGKTSRSSNNTTLSLEKLAERVDRLDHELRIVHFRISGSGTRSIPHYKVKQLSDSHGKWERERNQYCRREHQIRDLPEVHNQQLLLCKLEFSENRLKEYLSHPLPLTIQSQLEAALDGESILESIHVAELPEGREGLKNGLRLGLITEASEMEIFEWLKKAGITDYSIILKNTPKYVVRKRIKLNGGLGGANRVIFLVPSQRFMPIGDAGHSAIYSMKDGSCTGIGCELMD